MSNTKDVGIVSELKVLTELVSMGFVVSQPYGDNAPYDFIVDIEGKLLKVQVKTCIEYSDGSLKISLSKRDGVKRIKRTPYHSLDIDAIIAYSRKYNQFFYIDLHKYQVQEILLRPKSSIKVYMKTINIAEDFLLCNLLNKGI